MSVDCLCDRRAVSVAESLLTQFLGCPETVHQSCVRMTEGVECRKDADVIDETPAAYKSIDAVMAAQTDLVEVVHTLRQVVCVKG